VLSSREYMVKVTTDTSSGVTVQKKLLTACPITNSP
jgi:hypothetical protein